MLVARALFLLLAMSAAWVAQAADEDWMLVADQVIEQLDAALTSYQAGDAKTARREVIQAYFGPFEGEKMEAAIRSHLGIEPAFLLERQFGAIRKDIKSGAPEKEVALAVNELKQALKDHAEQLNEAGVPRSVYEVNQ